MGAATGKADSGAIAARVKLLICMVLGTAMVSLRGSLQVPSSHWALVAGYLAAVLSAPA